MRSCPMTEEGPDNEWKTLATWMFDPENDTQKEADSIANDFIDNCTSSVAIKRMKATKKKKKNTSSLTNNHLTKIYTKYNTYKNNKYCI